MRSVDRSFDDLLRDTAAIPLKIEDEQRSWTGSIMTFSLRARAGLLSAPIKGTVTVTERDLTIDADLGLLERFLGGSAAKTVLENKVRGLLGA